MKTLPSWINIALSRMRELGIKQIDLKEVFGVTTGGAVGHYFKGRSEITVEQLNNLSKKLDYDLNKIITEKSSKINEVDAREAITEGIFRALQANLIQLNDGVRVKMVTDSIIDELREDKLISSLNITG